MEGSSVDMGTRSHRPPTDRSTTRSLPNISRSPIYLSSCLKGLIFALQVNIEGEELSCAHMKSFNKEGAGSLYIYWDREWTKEYECQLVKYQTPFNALKPGDYVRCVEDQFKVKLA